MEKYRQIIGNLYGTSHLHLPEVGHIGMCMVSHGHLYRLQIELGRLSVLGFTICKPK